MEESKKKSGFATVGLVLGIIGTCTSFIPIFNNLSFAMALIGILFCIIALIKKASIKKSVIGIIFCILAIIFTIQAQKTLSTAIDDAVDTITGGKTQEILEKNLDVEIGDFEVVKDDFWDKTKLPVKVKNKSSEKKSFSIKIEAVDGEGTRLDTDTVYASDLNAGQTQNLEAFTLVASDKIEIMKNATYKIVEISMY